MRFNTAAAELPQSQRLKLFQQQVCQQMAVTRQVSLATACSQPKQRMMDLPGFCHSEGWTGESAHDFDPESNSKFDMGTVDQ